VSTRDSVRVGSALARAGVLMAMCLASCGCGSRAPEEFSWKNDPSALVAARWEDGGMAGRTEPGLGWNQYGASFVRLMGNGRLLYGSPDQVQVRDFNRQQVQDLLNAMEAERLASLDNHYACECITDVATVTLEVDTAQTGHRKVSAYALDHVSDSSGYPEALFRANDALKAVGAGGSPYTPSGLLLGSQPFAETHDPAYYEVLDWPIAGVDLATIGYSSGSHDWPKTATVSDPKQIETVLATVWPRRSQRTKGQLFKQNGLLYSVLFACQLP
jgi:hypothetical protein